ncbi:vitamin D(3) 25-hydroxylase-like [Dreissena polymorpha]|uniref:Cytochrome P450 n=1 Tax=Dreissena polymorpha TaxID=45954 RepID=A0A9D4H2X3_DREPO|nr:vitamin D(3) 25-hydroxylase-like [Dreissena polymorpha]KAH3826034.1 hypothetical protein DPMN_127923 [Dreissena polymorpha]
MVVFEALLCSCAVLVVVLIVLSVIGKVTSLSPPGPGGLPYIGQGLNFSVNSAHKQFTEWAKEYGDIVMFRMFGQPVVVLNNPDLIRKAFSAKDIKSSISDRPPSFIGQFVAGQYNDILFRKYDPLCADLKRVTIQVMYKTGASKAELEALVSSEIQDYVSKISAAEGDVDIIESLQTTLCKLIGVLYTGKRLSTDDPSFQAIADFDRAGNEIITPSVHLVLKVMPWLRHLPGYYGNLFDRTMQCKERLKRDLIQKEKEAGCGLISGLFEKQTTENWITDDMILGVAMDLINTSTLTSRGVISGVYFLLTHFPDVQDRIYQELIAVVGADRTPAVADMSMMPYTQACILETLRFQSHLPITATHTNLTDDVELEGYHIPRGASVYGNLWLVHHDDRVWSEPWKFKPERFLGADGSLLHKDPSLQQMRYFMPFGEGHRSCMGVRVTYDRMFLFVTLLLQRHRLLPPAEGALPSSDPRDLVPGTVLQAPKFYCRIVPR